MILNEWVTLTETEVASKNRNNKTREGRLSKVRGTGDFNELESVVGRARINI